jgi:hypothetical protein
MLQSQNATRCPFKESANVAKFYRWHYLYIKRSVRSARYLLGFVFDGQFSIPGRAGIISVLWPVKHFSYWVEKCFHLEGQQTVKQTTNVRLIPRLTIRGTLAPNSQNV